MHSDPRHIDLLLTSANQENPQGQHYCALIVSPWALLWLLHLVSCKWVVLIQRHRVSLDICQSREASGPAVLCTHHESMGTALAFAFGVMKMGGLNTKT